MKNKLVFVFAGATIIVWLLLAFLFSKDPTETLSEKPFACPEWTSIEGKCDATFSVVGIMEGRVHRHVMKSGEVIEIAILRGEFRTNNSSGVFIKTTEGELLLENSVLSTGVYFVYNDPTSFGKSKLELNHESGLGFFGNAVFHKEVYSPAGE